MRRAHPTSTSIVRQVALLRAQPVQSDLARILDGLDSWGALETALKLLPRLLAWGPKTISGITPQPWVGVVIWQRGSGYTGYKLLTLTGVWAIAQTDGAHVIVGRKRLPYAAPFYEAEAYHKLIRNGFDLYYSDDGAPPLAGRLYDVLYDADARLEMRAAIRLALTA